MSFDSSFGGTYLTRTTLCHTLPASGSQNVRQWSFLTRLAPSATESVNSRGRRRSMWACAFRATFISSISFIHLLILLYSHSFSKHCHSLHSSREEAQNPFPKTARLAAKSVCVYQDPYVGEGRWAAYTHTHTPQVQSVNQITRLATLQFAGVRSVQVLVIHKDRGSV